MQLRSLTDAGIAEARAFLDAVRADTSTDLAPLRDLLADPARSVPVRNGPEVARRAFATRRQAAAYLSPRLADLRPSELADAGLWSWLGLFYFEETVLRDGAGLPRFPARDHDTFLFPQQGQAVSRRYRHWLWTAWRLEQQHGEAAHFLLDRALTEFGDFAKAILGSPTRFNAPGVVPLVGSLYTEGPASAAAKRGFTSGRGSLWHLTRVLDQLERTYDVYGMPADALLRILPSDFDRWR